VAEFTTTSVPARIGKSTGGTMAPPTVAKRKTLAKQGKSVKGATKGSYPTNTPGRAVAAKAYSTQAVKAGRMSAGTKAGIDARANRELGKKPGLINQAKW
jgi:hypothetical protein